MATAPVCTRGIDFARCVIGLPVYEVELKFAVADPSGVRTRLEQLGAAWGPPILQRDQYFAHPCRDFVQTNEALRLRTVGDDHILTFKGPVIDRLTKTRREIETDLASTPVAAVAMTDTLMALGFRPVRVVEKYRRSATIRWQERDVTCALDDVPPLGTFVEFEIVTDEAGRTSAAETILSIATAMQLGEPERRSYLKMLLIHDGAAAPASPGE